MNALPKYKIFNNNIYDDWASDRTWSVTSIQTGEAICKCFSEEDAQKVCDALNLVAVFDEALEIKGTY